MSLADEVTREKKNAWDRIPVRSAQEDRISSLVERAERAEGQIETDRSRRRFEAACAALSGHRARDVNTPSADIVKMCLVDADALLAEMEEPHG